MPYFKSISPVKVTRFKIWSAPYNHTYGYLKENNTKGKINSLIVSLTNHPDSSLAETVDNLLSSSQLTRKGQYRRRVVERGSPIPRGRLQMTTIQKNKIHYQY
jgi:hypothetical protein